MWNHIRAGRRFTWIAVMFLAITGAACAHATPHVQGTRAQRDAPIVLMVHNDNWYDMRVYELRASGAVGPRVATVTGLTSAQVRLRPQQVLDGYVRLLLRPIGSPEVYVTDAVMVRPGARVQLRVMNNLGLSYLYTVEN